MARSLANVDITTDSFLTWVSQTNKLLDALSNEVLTVSTSAAGGNSTLANTTGNAQLIGIFGANTLVATNALRGGNNSSSANLTVSSNVLVTGSILKVGSTLNLNALGISVGSNLSINASSLSVGNSTVNTSLNSSLLSIANSTITANVNPSGLYVGGSTVNSTHLTSNTLILNTDYEIRVLANNDIGSNTTAGQTVFSFDSATYSSAKITAQIKNSGNTQVSEMVLAHDGTSAYITVFGTVISPLVSDLGDFTVAINGSDVELRVQQRLVSSSVKIIAHLIK